MRRRALCAASAVGGEAPPTFEFPVYIKADYCEEDTYLSLCYNCVSESLGESFYLSFLKYLEYILKKYGEKSEYEGNTMYNIYSPSEYGIIIYVETNKGKMSQVDFLELYDNGFFTSIDATHELGGIGNNYVQFSEIGIYWGCGV